MEELKTTPFSRPSDDIDERNLMIKIWFRPKETLQYILMNCPRKNVILFLVLGGVVRGLSRASMNDMGDGMPTLMVVLIAVATGGSLGWIMYYLYAWLLSVTGNWMDGEAEPGTFRTVVAWALVPMICSLFLLIPELLIFGDDVFRSVKADQSSTDKILWLFFGLIEIILGLWSLAILIQGISVVQGFSIGKALLNLLSSILIFVGPFLVLGLLLSLNR